MCEGTEGKSEGFSGQVSEGLDVLASINEAFVDEANRPLQNVRIRHTVVLDDPFPDPPQLNDHIPEHSPPPEYTTGVRISSPRVAFAGNTGSGEV